jgi:peptidyl-prolyl cis-trans isomerase C
MAISLGSRKPGTYLVIAAAAVMTLTISSAAIAEPVATINGVEIDSVLFDMYLETRTQKAAGQATPAERDTIMQELTDIYLLTTQPIADDLAKGDLITAQIELQGRGILAQAVAQDFFNKNQATEAEIQAEYDIQMAMSPPLQFKARHILVETQAAAADLISELQDAATLAGSRPIRWSRNSLML